MFDLFRIKTFFTGHLLQDKLDSKAKIYWEPFVINNLKGSYEVNARRIFKDLMYDINLKDCFRELVPTGGSIVHL